MMGGLLNIVRREIQRALANLISSRSGVVTSYDSNRYAAKVQLQPDGVISGWIPVASPWIGNGWGLFAPPSPGDQVTVDFAEGHISAGTVVGRIWDNNNQPLPVPAGEYWLVHKNGQSIKLTNDGKVTLDDGQGATFQLDGAGNVVISAKQMTINGPLHVTGNIQVDQTLTANTDVIGGGKSLKSHTHGNVQNGGGHTNPPD